MDSDESRVAGRRRLSEVQTKRIEKTSKKRDFRVRSGTLSENTVYEKTAFRERLSHLPPLG
jgi:hypothetical protein